MGEKITRWWDRWRAWHKRIEGRVLARTRGWSTRRRYLAFVLAPLFVLCCCGTVVGAPLAWVVRITIEAGQGLPSPDAAADSYLLALSYDQDDGLLPVLADDGQDELVAQWRAYRADMEATDPPPDLLSWGPLDVSQSGHGRAQVLAHVSANWSSTDAVGRLSMWQSDTHTWVIDAADDGDGWRVTRVQPPPWCGGYVIRCGPADGAAPSASSAAAPSPTPSDDPLRHPREMLRCGPRDPFRELHDCPPTSAAPSVQPIPSSS